MVEGYGANQKRGKFYQIRYYRNGQRIDESTGREARRCAEPCSTLMPVFGGRTPNSITTVGTFSVTSEEALMRLLVALETLAECRRRR